MSAFTGRYALPVAVLVLAVATLCFGVTFAVSRGNPQATPTRTVNIFLDGINSADFRQACSVQDLGGARMHDCELYYASIIAQASFTGGVDHYRVVPHSVKVWEQPYQDRTVRLSTVDFRYGPQSEQVLTAHLRWSTGRDAWVLTRID